MPDYNVFAPQFWGPSCLIFAILLATDPIVLLRVLSPNVSCRVDETVVKCSIDYKVSSSNDRRNVDEQILYLIKTV